MPVRNTGVADLQGMAPGKVCTATVRLRPVVHQGKRLRDRMSDVSHQTCGARDGMDADTADQQPQLAVIARREPHLKPCLNGLPVDFPNCVIHLRMDQSSGKGNVMRDVSGTRKLMSARSKTSVLVFCRSVSRRLTRFREQISPIASSRWLSVSRPAEAQTPLPGKLPSQCRATSENPSSLPIRGASLATLRPHRSTVKTVATPCCLLRGPVMRSTRALYGAARVGYAARQRLHRRFGCCRATHGFVDEFSGEVHFGAH